MKNFFHKSVSLPGLAAALILGLSAGLAPLLFSSDINYVALLLLIFLGLFGVLLLYYFGMAESALLYAFGISLIFNPKKFIFGSKRGFFGIPQGHFISLSDLTFLSLVLVLVSRSISRGEKPFSAPNALQTVLLVVYLTILTASCIAAKDQYFAQAQLGFEFKMAVIFLALSCVNYASVTDSGRNPVVIMLYGVGLGVMAESVLAMLQYARMIPQDFMFMSLNLGRYEEVLGGVVYDRIGGTFGHPNFLAALLAGLALPLFVMTIKAKGFGKFWFGSAFLALLVAIVMTLSRGGWLGMTSAFFIFVVIGPYRTRLMNVISEHKTTALVLVLVGVSLGVAFAPKVAAKFVESSPENVSSRVMLNTWALQMIEDHPLAGVGLNNCIVAGKNYQIFDYYERAFKYPPVPHNFFLLLASEIGTPGAIILGLLLLAIVLASVRTFKIPSEFSPLALRVGFTAGVFGYLVSDLFGYSLRKYEIAYIFWWHLACVVILTRLCREERRP